MMIDERLIIRTAKSLVDGLSVYDGFADDALQWLSAKCKHGFSMRVFHDSSARILVNPALAGTKEDDCVSGTTPAEALARAVIAVDEEQRDAVPNVRE